MTDEPREIHQHADPAPPADVEALTALFVRHRDRLRKMVRLRLDRRLLGRLDSSEVLQEAYLDIARRAEEYLADPAMPPFHWLRFLTAQKLVAMHHRHLGAQVRDAGREISLHRGALSHATSVSLAHQLLGRSAQRL
jgi:RNA polymerase sigma-70 factor (ECF subfamily)